MLNDPPLAAGGATALDVAGALATRTLAAFGAATDGAGRVDYERLAGSEELAAATETARRLGGADASSLGERGARLAFWINVYNALVLHGIVRLGVRRSVTRAWNFFGRACFRVDGFVVSSDDVEHGILRGNHRRFFPPLRPFRRGDPRLAHAVSPVDPRIHFALNCGARSCPPVGVYRAEAIDAQLDLATGSYVNGEVAVEDGRLVCPRVFKWYRGDFAGVGGLEAFLLRYLDDGPARAMLTAGSRTRVTFRSWDWSLHRSAVE